jgi:ABC-type multidrug transport system permease subunit
VQLWLVRVRTFLREPGVLFWVFGFPVLLAVALGLAFRNRGPEKAAVVVGEAAGAEAEAAAASKALGASEMLDVRSAPLSEAEARFARGDALVLVVPGTPPVVRHDPGRPGAPAAALAVADALERAAGRKDVLSMRAETRTIPGQRYIDFLIPGLLGMGLMSGGVWGVGYEIVSLRVKRLLKRLMATPMSRPAFLGSFLAHRLVIAVVETSFLLLFGMLAFGVEVRGSFLAAIAIGLAGALSFAGLGLLTASRARNVETANGLMNLVALPMWLLSGVFFSTSNFPDWMRPLVDALPLTALNDALRAVVNTGAPLASTWPELLVLAAWAVVSYAVALRLFRWQ